MSALVPGPVANALYECTMASNIHHSSRLWQDLARTSMQNNGIWDSGWAAGWGEQRQSALVYKSAILEGGQLATSTRYLRSRSRNGSRVLVAFETPSGNQQLYAAEVLIMNESICQQLMKF